ncbi:hypothetical protein AVEN_41965-1, partial [Araneus ventricosus]
LGVVYLVGSFIHDSYEELEMWINHLLLVRCTSAGESWKIAQ